MALTPDIYTTQGGSQVVAEGGDVRTSQAGVMAIANFPSEQLNSSQTGMQLVGEGGSEVKTTQTGIIVVAKGRVDDPKVRVWTYTQDGHDYYVIRLGNIETLVYDTHSDQWSVYGSNDSNLWKAFQGINWIGSDFLANEYGSNVIVGDDGNGSLYFLNPELYTDDDSVDGAETPRVFKREFQGQLQKRSYDYERNYAVELLGSIGKMENTSLTAITLSISDDEGISYTDMGTVTIANGDYGRRVDWRSLGSFTAPGRLFKITDYGALHRIDSLTADTDKERS